MFPETIEGEGLRLEAFCAGNLDELWKSIVSDRDNPKRRGIWPGIGSKDELRAYFSICELPSPVSGETGYVIRVSGELAGTFHVFSVNKEEGRAELGYGLHHAFEGRGLATRALAAVEHSLKGLGFRRLRIQCPVWNEKSWRVAERSGYAFVRTCHKDKACAGCEDCLKVYEKAVG